MSMNEAPTDPPSPPAADDDLSDLFPDLAPVLQRWESAGETPPEPPGGGVDDSEGTEPVSVGDESTTSPSEQTVEDATDEEPPDPASQISDAELEQIIAMRSEIAANPELRDLIAGWYTNKIGQQPPGSSASAAPGPVVPVPSAQPSPAAAAQPPPDIDLDDPSVKALYDLNQQQQQRINELTVGLRAQADQQAMAQRTQSESLFRRATESFRSRHNLQQADVDQISQVAARMRVLPALMSGMDPITGLPVRPDPLTAVERSLEIAMSQIPAYQTETRERNKTRKRNLASVSSSPGSVPRATPAPSTPDGNRRAMLTEVASMLSGSWSEPSN